MLDNDSKIVDAILMDDEKALKALLANPMVNPNGEYCDASYLCLAIMNKKMWAVEQFCDHILVDLNTRSKALGQTPLQYAIHHDGDIAVYLLKRQANPNATDRHGDTALHTVMKVKTTNLLAYDDLIEDLLKDRRLNVMAKNDDGVTAYELAPYHIRPLLAENLRIKLWLKSHPEFSPKKEESLNSLYETAKRGHLEVVKGLIKSSDDEVLEKNNESFENILNKVATTSADHYLKKHMPDKRGSLSGAFGKAAGSQYITNGLDKETYSDEIDLYKKAKGLKRPGTVKRP